MTLQKISLTDKDFKCARCTHAADAGFSELMAVEPVSAPTGAINTASDKMGPPPESTVIQEAIEAPPAAEGSTTTMVGRQQSNRGRKK